MYFWLSFVFGQEAPGAVFFFIHNVIYFAQLTPVCFVPIFFACLNEISVQKELTNFHSLIKKHFNNLFP
jgi:hypothetical protein